MKTETKEFRTLIDGLSRLHDVRAPASLSRTLDPELLSVPANASAAASLMHIFSVRHIAAGAGVFGLAGIMTVTAAFAAGHPRPGTVLYSVRQSAENLIDRLPLGKAGVYMNLKFASDRVGDIREAVSSSDSAALKQVTGDYETHVRQAAEGTDRQKKDAEDLKQTVTHELQTQKEQLDSIGNAAPTGEQPAIIHAAGAAGEAADSLNSVPETPAAGQENNAHATDRGTPAVEGASDHAGSSGQEDNAGSHGSDHPSSQNEHTGDH